MSSSCAAGESSSSATPTMSETQHYNTVLDIDFDSLSLFGRGLRHFFENDSLADATIRCEDKELKVHAVVCAAHSDYFMKAFCGPWKESKGDREMTLHEVDADVVTALVQYMYHFDYKPPENAYATVFHAKVYSLADRYQMPQLKQHSKKKFDSAMKKFWLHQQAGPISSELFLALDEIYTSTPDNDRGLRDIITRHCHNNKKLLETDTSFHMILREVPALAVDMIFYHPFDHLFPGSKGLPLFP
ncbi:BTB/POZ protein [Xylariaceae sp. FL1019]|nr:BTB/POZ protein [Xylariaceae sp. FL1019]